MSLRSWGQLKDWLYWGDPMSFSHPKVAPSRWDQKPLYRVVGGSSCICSEDEFLSHHHSFVIFHKLQIPSNTGLSAPDIWYLWLPFPSHLPRISFFWWNSFKIAKTGEMQPQITTIKCCGCYMELYWSKKWRLFVYQNITLKINQVSNETPIGTNWCGNFSCMLWLPWSFSVSTSWGFFSGFLLLYLGITW